MKDLFILDFFYTPMGRVSIEAIVDIKRCKVLDKRITMNSVEISIDRAINMFLKYINDVRTGFNVYVDMGDKTPVIATYSGLFFNNIDKLGIDSRTFFPALLKKIWKNIDSVFQMKLIHRYKIDSLEVIVIFDRESMSSMEYVDEEKRYLEEPKTVKSIRKYVIGYIPEMEGDDGIYQKQIIEIEFDDGKTLHFLITGWDFTVDVLESKGRISMPRAHEIKKLIDNYIDSIDEMEEFWRG